MKYVKLLITTLVIMALFIPIPAVAMSPDVVALPETPFSVDDFEVVWECAARTRKSTIQLHYDLPYNREIHDYFRATLERANIRCRNRKPELYGYVRAKKWTIIDATRKGFDLVITFGPIDETVDPAMLDVADAVAQRIRTNLYSFGVLTPDMSDREKARIYTIWVAENVTYKEEPSAICHTAYSAFVRHSGVCDAYVAALQTLLRLEGIECDGIVGNAGGNALHAWTRAKLNGEWLNIDPCWYERINDKYFAVPDKEFFQHHVPG